MKHTVIPSSFMFVYLLAA